MPAPEVTLAENAEVLGLVKLLRLPSKGKHDLGDEYFGALLKPAGWRLLTAQISL
ncbi:hypothetical protein QZH52_33300 [Variovorax ginsengisoli]|uniref:Uncharacterized protein n=1 Tax=Variovorax ginsengisoli TaxID=363844 RepID=A0ABT8SFN8_9BURK|nr:hypothetical protein [Variovorax ginsengisoli]MDO1537154.1 hypothetical protein [Variovorax ginsengisoli]